MTPAARTVLFSTGLNAGKEPPVRVVGGSGVHFVLEDGRRVLDASNTGGPLGHAHPELVEAVRRAASAPAINEGWLWAEREEAARELAELAFAGEEDWFGSVRFCLSGSEANDLALSLCQAVTGRTAIATRERAYHGMCGLARDVTVQPHWHGGVSSASGARPVPRSVDVRILPPPGNARIGEDLFESVELRHDDLTAELAGTAAVIVDYTQGGRYYDARFQDTVAAAAGEAGTKWIADEVVTGLGRFGRWFAYQGAGSRPDLVTLGKPLGGGAAPAGAIVLSRRLADSLADSTWQTYSTFRGHPISVAAVRAHLRVLARDGIIDRVPALERVVERQLRDIATRHPSVRRVDGTGLHWTVELHGEDWRRWQGTSEDAAVATRVAARALEAGALIGTSGEATSLFLAPPLIVEEEELTAMLVALDHGLDAADAELA